MHIWEQHSYHYPLAPYKNRTGAYIDSDEDNIPDIVESLLSNNSTFVKFARLFADPTSEYYDLWTSYNWTIAYFFSLRNNKNFHYYLKYLNAEKYSAEEIARYITGWNNTAPHNKSCGENATQWLRDEFNPIIVESMSPVITQFIAITDVGCFYAYTKVTVELRDPSGIGRIILKSQPEKDVPLIYDIRVFDANGSKIWSVSNLKLNITAGSSLWHYYVVCNATDLLNNTAEWSKEIKGIVKLIVDTVAKALSMLRGVMCEIGAKIAEAIQIVRNFVVDTLINIFSGLRGIIETIIQRGKDFYTGKVDLLSAITFGLSLSAIAGRVMLIGLGAFAFALLFLASTIITMDDFIYAEMVGLMGFGATALFSKALGLFTEESSTNVMFQNSIDLGKICTKGVQKETIRKGFYLSFEFSFPIEPMLYIAGGPGVEIVWAENERKPRAYTYLQTPTLEFSWMLGGIMDLGLAIEISPLGFGTEMHRASLSLRLLNIGIGIPTNSNEYGYIEIGINEFNLPLAVQWSESLNWQYTGPIISGGD